jgi:hypothetical protein
MVIRLKTFVAAATVAYFIIFPCSIFAGMGLTIATSDSFLTKVIRLQSFGLNNGNHPAGTYSFKLIGTGRPGTVGIRILDSAGKDIGKLMGRFGGVCPGKPSKSTFAELGYSNSSAVKIAAEDNSTRLTVEGGRGSKIVFTLDKPVD